MTKEEYITDFIVPEVSEKLKDQFALTSKVQKATQSIINKIKRGGYQIDNANEKDRNFAFHVTRVFLEYKQVGPDYDGKGYDLLEKEKTIWHLRDSLITATNFKYEVEITETDFIKGNFVLAVTLHKRQ